MRTKLETETETAAGKPPQTAKVAGSKETSR
jgi:hypothetical protein